MWKHLVMETVRTGRSPSALGEQLAPVLLRMRRARVEPVCQVTMSVPTDDVDATFGAARTEALRWMQERAGRRLPAEAWDGGSFDLADIGAPRTEATFLEEIGYWAGRVDAVDATAPERSWTTETAVVEVAGTIRFGARLTCVVRGESEPFVPSVPGPVKQVVDGCGGVLDGRSIGGGPWLVDTPEEAFRLVEFMSSPDRQCDVLAISTRGSSDDPDATLIQARSVFERTIGAAHVVVVTATGNYALTELVGKELSVFRQAVRTYRPGFDPEGAAPREHPLALGMRIADWPGGPSGFEDFLVANCLRGTVDRPDRERLLPSYVAIKQAAQKLRKKTAAAGSITDSERVAVLENEELRRDNQDYEALLEIAEEELSQVRDERDAARGEIWRLKNRVEYLERQDVRGPVAEDEIPDAFDDLERWAARHLAGKVTLTGRAIRAAKDSPFEDARLAYRALLILRDRYVPMRREGGLDLKEAYRKALEKEALQEQPTFAGTRSGEHGDVYFVRHRGRRRELDLHLKGSDSRDPRFGFRLYFFWDNENEEVVVGSLPNHLKTRIT